jgi:hypothetical protein
MFGYQTGRPSDIPCYQLIPVNHNVTKIGYLVKGKAIPLQAWTGPEGYSKLRLPDFKTIGK